MSGFSESFYYITRETSKTLLVASLGYAPKSQGYEPRILTTRRTRITGVLVVIAIHIRVFMFHSINTTVLI